MKAIMISIKPKWCAKIMNGDKTIEIRKNKGLYKAIQKLIDTNGYADIYAYCSKDKINLCYKCINGEYDYDHWKVLENRDSDSNILNGKVVFKFRCYALTKIEPNCFALSGLSHNNYFGYKVNEDVITKLSCLSSIELDNYLKRNTGYAIHISDLEIFDRPRELSEFIQTKRKSWEEPNVIRAPQNFCYLEM